MNKRVLTIPLLTKLSSSRFLKRFLCEERGVQLAELAIVMPLFLVLFGATAEFGRYFYEYTTLAKASRVAARYLATATVNASSDSAAKNLVVFGNTGGTGTPILSGLTTGNVFISRQGAVTQLPQTVKVEIKNFKHQPILDLGKLAKLPSLSLNIEVKPSVTMRYLLTQPAI